jgi:hypothetical protein
VGAATDGATGATFEPATAGETKRAGKAAGRDAPGAADPPAANGVGTGQDSQPVGVQPAQPKAVAAWTTLVPPYSDASPLPAQGRAMYYNPGVMAEVLAYRLNLGHVTPCPECIGYAALLRSGDINRKVWIQWPDGVVDGPYLVVDVAAKQHVGTLLARNWVVDVDHETAARRGMNQPLAVTVLAGPAAQ